MIKIVLVDDEQSACDNLSYLLNKHVDNSEIVGIANTVDQGIALIEKEQPDLVFLDIEMPQKNGFELVHYFENLELYFHIIFVTAYESYAIKAFEVSALDYLLKPIDVDRLKGAIEKFYTQKKDFKRNFEVFQKNIEHKTIETIAVQCQNDYIFINTDSILCIEANRAYSIIKVTNAKFETEEFLSSRKLIYYEDLFKGNSFIRVHRSWIINFKKVSYYSKKDNYLILNDVTIPVSRNYKSQIEKLLFNE